MDRRTYLKSAASISAATVRFPTISAASSSHGFIDEFGLAVVDFFDDDWGRKDLEDEVGEAVNFVCYAYGKLADQEDEEHSADAGFLSQLEQISLSNLKQNPEAYNWILEYLQDIVYFVSELDVFADSVAGRLESFAEDARNITKYIPLIGSIKGVLDSGCSIHKSLERDEQVAESAYVKFFKCVALAVVEVVLLVTGVGASYRVAFGATGWVNQQLINVVGRSIGWRAYAWVLSQIHWGIRVAFAEGSGLAIDRTVGEVTTIVVSDAQTVETDLDKEETRQWVQNDVEEIVGYVADGELDYMLWELDQLQEETLRKAERRQDRFLQSVNDFVENLPF
ncbi:hypothetical protein [Haloarcula litorea]|uniref:hypothetical protein n=1 Tax=Haloarcula litorea TaxID=3032579 RepID=UPI0023E81805|nr:hypothetical protein [Halomicroarcula sp. GDY20]